MYTPKHFKPEELVPQETITALGAGALWVMDDRILMMADAIRDYFMEAVTINDYGREMQYRGFRTPNCKEYKQYSQHSFGRAIDLDITGKNADEVRKIILDSPDKFSFITCIEIGVPWVHIDCRNCVAVLQVKPN